MQKILLQFCKKLWVEQGWGTVGIAGLLVVGSVFIWGRVSISEPSFSLPQIGLGLGLYGVATLLILLSFLSYYAGRADAAAKDKAALSHPTIGLIDADDALRKVVRIRVSSDGEGIIVYKNGDDGEFRAYLDIVNFAPFPIEIERIVGEFVVRNSPVGKLQHLQRAKVGACDAASVYVHADLTAEQIKKIAFQLAHANGHVDGVGFRLLMYVEYNGRRVELMREVLTGNARFTNFSIKP